MRREGAAKAEPAGRAGGRALCCATGRQAGRTGPGRVTFVHLPPSLRPSLPQSLPPSLPPPHTHALLTVLALLALLLLLLKARRLLLLLVQHTAACQEAIRRLRLLPVPVAARGSCAAPRALPRCVLRVGGGPRRGRSRAGSAARGRG